MFLEEKEDFRGTVIKWVNCSQGNQKQSWKCESSGKFIHLGAEEGEEILFSFFLNTFSDMSLKNKTVDIGLLILSKRLILILMWGVV